MKSFNDVFAGYERLCISLEDPGSFLGTIARGEILKLEKGGILKGPAILPSFNSASILILTISFFKWTDTMNNLGLGLWVLQNPPGIRHGEV